MTLCPLMSILLGATDRHSTPGLGDLVLCIHPEPGVRYSHPTSLWCRLRYGYCTPVYDQRVLDAGQLAVDLLNCFVPLTTS